MAYTLDTSGYVAKPGNPIAAPNDRRMQCKECGRDNRGHKGEACGRTAL